MNLAQAVIREPAIRDVPHCRKRVRALSWIFILLFVFSLSGVAIIAARVKLFVTLAQRSNVETLTLAFLFLFFVYVTLVSGSGAWGAAQIFWFRVLERRYGRTEATRARVRRLGRANGLAGPVVAFNVVIELEGAPRQPLLIPIDDEHGSMGRLLIRGARVEHLESVRDGTNSLFAFFEQSLARILKRRTTSGEGGPPIRPDIVEWKKIDDEETEKFLGLVSFAQALEQYLGARGLWPTVVLSREELEELRRDLSGLCPVLREEAFLPQWEYSGEHKLPIIPEPLGIVSLTRSEKRVDPLSSMGAARRW